MRTSTDRRPATPWYREPMVWMLIAIPGSSVAFGVFMLFVSIQSYDGLVVDDYYKRGMEINQVLDRDRAAARNGMSAQLRVDAGEVTVRLDAVPEFAPPAAVELGLYHSTRGGLDRSLTLLRGDDGVYRAALEPLAPGAWNLQLQGDDWRLTGRFAAGEHHTLQMAPPIRQG